MLPGKEWAKMGHEMMRDGLKGDETSKMQHCNDVVSGIHGILKGDSSMLHPDRRILSHHCTELHTYWVMFSHYDDVRMGAIASQITSLTIVYWSVYSGAYQSKHQSSASLAFVWGIHRGPVNSPHKWPVTRRMFPFDDVIIKNRPQWVKTGHTLGH